MTVPFPDIDPYEELGVKNSDAPPVIKKAYYKLCLQYHPDKHLHDSKPKKAENKVKFEKIQFSYSIVGDVKRRSIYDQTGSINGSVLDDDIDWKALFKKYATTKVTEEMIEEDRIKYQDSTEERDDILKSMQYYDGDFMKLFEVIPHLEFDKDEESRIYDIVEGLIKSKKLKSSNKWKKYVKNRKREIRKRQRKLQKESVEAEKMMKELKKKKKVKDGEMSLKAMIQSRHGNDPFDALIAKYSGKNKRSRKDYDIDDDEFQEIQKKMMKKRK